MNRETPSAGRSSIAVHAATESRVGGVTFEGLPFSTVFSDHVLTAAFEPGGWKGAAIRPYGPLPLAPNISALQYGVSVFEGLKAHRTPSGDVVLFRPWENAKRLNRSASRLAMPQVPLSLFLNGLHELLRVDRAWVPPSGVGALYVRPCLFSTDPSVRVMPAAQYAFVVFTFPFGVYYAEPLDVLVEERYVRAFPGGTGDVKPAGNYAGALLAERDAREAGFHTVMWLDGLEHRYVEECGVMNVFFVIDDVLVTPSLTGTILPGVTRDSVLTLARDLGHRVEERRVSIDEVVAAHDRGTLHECFGTGTAATLTHVRRIRYRHRDLTLPPVESRRVGPLLRERLVGISAGELPDPHAWLDRV